ncbi:beta-propeller domain-containing protein [Eubacteriales bacterium OttesenSCG-928-N14]|nr:beta-propeller domain-containing protein [Eubacteriales bacterium OttesenSCG-928-N14]
MSFEKQYRKDNDTIHASEEAKQKVHRSLQDNAASRKKKSTRAPWLRVVAVAACAALVLIGTLSIGGQQDNMPLPSNGDIASAKDYAQIYNEIKNLEQSNGFRDTNGALPEDAGISSESSTGDGAPSPTGGTDDGGKEFSNTNTQVAGIDEADIVKTDGKYIYVLADGTLYIVQAEGKKSKVLGKQKIAVDGNEKSLYPTEMYLVGNRLVLLLNEYEISNYGYYEPDGRMVDCWMPSVGKTYAAIYDIDDAGNIKEISRIGQDGSYQTSRMQNGMLYLISNHHVYEEMDPEKPSTFVPSLYSDGAKETVDAANICIPPMPSSTSYIVISSIDVTNAQRVDDKSILGFTSNVYMSQNNILIAQSDYYENEVGKRQEAPYSVTTYESGSKTTLLRFSIDGGKITQSASGQVPGALLNQFSMDEYNDNIRLVTTVDEMRYEIYLDEKNEWSNYKDISSKQNNALYVLGMDLNVVGKIEGLANDERIYSARFMGDVGYFVTFRQVDPLFAVDLSNPASPKITSELKIPGFSQYLHGYGDGLLFGLGMDADAETGQSGNMKLSMFDVSDAFNVTEKHKLLLSGRYSEALYNHKAIMILPDKNIIAFPVESGYEVYGYGENGFTLKHRLTIEDSYNSRGVWIENELYICSQNSVVVFDALSFNPLTTVRFK